MKGTVFSMLAIIFVTPMIANGGHAARTTGNKPPIRLGNLQKSYTVKPNGEFKAPIEIRIINDGDSPFYLDARELERLHSGFLNTPEKKWAELSNPLVRSEKLLPGSSYPLTISSLRSVDAKKYTLTIHYYTGARLLPWTRKEVTATFQIELSLP